MLVSIDETKVVAEYGGWGAERSMNRYSLSATIY
jgi:hypothetical protein